nr:helix-turn-helix domain-containing protein [Marinobacter subterrani]
MTPAQICEARAMASSKKFNKSGVASHFGISRPTLYKYLNANPVSEERCAEPISTSGDKVSIPDDTGKAMTINNTT